MQSSSMMGSMIRLLFMLAVNRFAIFGYALCSCCIPIEAHSISNGNEEILVFTRSSSLFQAMYWKLCLNSPPVLRWLNCNWILYFTRRFWPFIGFWFRISAERKLIERLPSFSLNFEFARALTQFNWIIKHIWQEVWTPFNIC